MQAALQMYIRLQRCGPHQAETNMEDVLTVLERVVLTDLTWLWSVCLPVATLAMTHIAEITTFAISLTGLADIFLSEYLPRDTEIIIHVL